VHPFTPTPLEQILGDADGVRTPPNGPDSLISDPLKLREHSPEQPEAISIHTPLWKILGEDAPFPDPGFSPYGPYRPEHRFGRPDGATYAEVAPVPMSSQFASTAKNPDTEDGMIGRIVGSIGNFLGGDGDGSAPHVTIPLKAPELGGGSDTDGGGDSGGFKGRLKEMFPNSPDGGDAGGGREVAAPQLPSANDQSFHPPALSPIPAPHPNTWAVNPPAQSVPPGPYLPALDGVGDGVLADVVGQAVTHPRQTMDLMRKLAPLAADYTGDHPGRVAGRLLPSALIGKATNSPITGVTLGGIALYGDVIHALRNGATTEEEIIRDIMGGETP